MADQRCPRCGQDYEPVASGDHNGIHGDRTIVPHHTVEGRTSERGWPYGTKHDMNCPACQDIPFTLSPRSETYWSS